MPGRVEDNLTYFKTGGRPQILKKGRLPQIYLETQDDHNYFKMEELKRTMSDDLKLFN